MRASVWLLGILLFSPALYAQEEEQPSMELLAFLGEWEEADTNWIEQALSGWQLLAGEAETNEESNDDE